MLSNDTLILITLEIAEHSEVVQFLITAGADVNVASGYLRTPLYEAAAGKFWMTQHEHDFLK